MTTRNTLKARSTIIIKIFFTESFLMEELEYVIDKINPNKACGGNLIVGPMVQHFGEIAKKQLLEIFTLSWTSGKLPKA